MNSLPVQARHWLFPCTGKALALAFLATSIPFAQTPSTQTNSTQVKDEARHTVSGTVTNSVTGAPIGRAMVNLFGQRGQFGTMTDANGAFRFEGVSEGTVAVTAQRPGFLNATAGKERVVLQVGGDLDGVAVSLTPQATVTGRVSSLQERPLEDLPVVLYRREIADGRAEWERDGNSVAGEDGSFRFASLRAGTYCLAAGPENWRPRASASHPSGYGETFYPNAPDIAGCAPIALAAGQQVEIDFSLQAEPFFEISGQVAGLAENDGVTISLTDSAGESLPIVQPHPGQHDFSSYVASGHYTLRALGDIGGHAARVSVPLNVTSNVIGIQVALGTQAPIPVEVRALSGGGNAEDAPHVNLQLVSTSESINPTTLWASWKGDGRHLSIDNAEPGTYMAKIDAFNGYVQSATSGSTDLLHEALQIPAEGRAGPIEVVVGQDGGTIKGIVNLPQRNSEPGSTRGGGDGSGGEEGTLAQPDSVSTNPGAAAAVLLVPDGGNGNEVKTAFVDGSGAFEFEQLRPGDYLLLAFDQIDNLEFRNPQALSGYLSNATRVNVGARQQVRAAVDLTLREK